MENRPPQVTTGDFFRVEVGEQVELAILRAAQGMHIGLVARLAMLLFDFAARRLPSEQPFFHVDRAITVQVEAFEQVRLVFLPLAQQFGDIGFGVQFGRSAAEGAKVTERVDGVVDQELPLGIAVATVGPCFFVTGENFGVFDIDDATAATVFKNE